MTALSIPAYVPVCDFCHTAPATMHVDCNAKHFHSIRCDEHAFTAVADLQADGSFVRTTALVVRKPYSVELADTIYTDSSACVRAS